MSISKNPNNIPIPKKWTEDDLFNIVKMRNEGFTLKEIGKKYGVGKSSIHQAIKRYKLQTIEKPKAKDGYQFCSCCGKELPFDSFYHAKKKKNGLTSACKECICEQQRIVRNTPEGKLKHKQRNQQWKAKNKDKYKQYSRNYLIRHPEARKQTMRIYYENHRGQIQEYAKSYLPKHNASCKKYNAKVQEDPVYRMIFRMRSLVYVAFKKVGCCKSKRTKEIIGLSAEEFHEYLLGTFRSIYGKEWDGKEEVNIDHIIPISTAKTEEDVIRLNHYSNLRLITKEDNLKKGTKLNYSIGGISNDLQT